MGLLDRTSHVWIDGHRHAIIPTDSLENLAFFAGLDIELRDDSGWATTRLGSHRFAAWIGVAKGETAMSARYTYREKPIAVIDPNDSKQVARLRDLVSAHCPYSAPHHTADIAEALREFAAPSSPPEPQGLGAVVEDADGYLWVGATNENRRRWYNPLRGGSLRHGWCDYADIVVARVVSAGFDMAARS